MAALIVLSFGGVKAIRGNLGSAQTSDETAALRLTTENIAQFILGALEHAFAAARQIFAGSIDVEIQHGHCRLIGSAFAPLAPFRRSFQRYRDFFRIVRSKNL